MSGGNNLRFYFFVKDGIPREAEGGVENGATGGSCDIDGRPEAERTGVSESNLLPEADQKN
jgi:hypothetical protein